MGLDVAGPKCYTNFTFDGAEATRRPKPSLNKSNENVVGMSPRIDMIDVAMVKHGRELVGLFKRKLQERAKFYLDFSSKVQLFYLIFCLF